MADVKWIKMSTGLPDNRKLKQIRRLPEGDTIALMWVFLMCLAGEVNENGLIYFTPEIPYTDEMLADEFNMEINTIRLGLQTFQKFGMIEIVNDIIRLSSWEKWQSTDRLSEIREYNRLAKQKSRSKQKLLQSQSVNDKSMTSQCCHDTDIDIEEDIDIDKIKSKSNKFVAPTYNEVAAYCNERHNNVDRNRFIDYYTSNGWMVGKNKMKDWKAAVRNWERGNNNTSSSGSSGGDKFMQDLKRIGAEIYGKSETDH